MTSEEKQTIRHYIERLEQRLAAAEVRQLCIAENALGEVEKPTPLMPLGEPGSVMRRAQEFGRRLQAAEARAAALAELAKELVEHAGDVECLVGDSSNWIHDSTLWEADEELGPKWQTVYNRHGDLRARLRALLASGPGAAAAELAGLRAHFQERATRCCDCQSLDVFATKVDHDGLCFCDGCAPPGAVDLAWAAAVRKAGA